MLYHSSLARRRLHMLRLLQVGELATALNTWTWLLTHVVTLMRDCTQESYRHTQTIRYAVGAQILCEPSGRPDAKKHSRAALAVSADHVSVA